KAISEALRKLHAMALLSEGLEPNKVEIAAHQASEWAEAARNLSGATGGAFDDLLRPIWRDAETISLVRTSRALRRKRSLAKGRGRAKAEAEFHRPVGGPKPAGRAGNERRVK